MKSILAAALLFCTSTLAQAPNTTPQPLNYFGPLVEVDVRLKGPVRADGTIPTLRLERGKKFNNLDVDVYTFTVECWNTVTPCPPVTGITFQVYLRKLGITLWDVTSRTGLCGTATECAPPTFPAIQAKPGEAYMFRYSRSLGRLAEPPRILAAGEKIPPLSVIIAAPASVSFLYTRGGPLPAPVRIVATAPDRWSSRRIDGPSGIALFDADECYIGAGRSCASGEFLTIVPKNLGLLPVGVHTAGVELTSGTLRLVVPVAVTVR